MELCNLKEIIDKYTKVHIVDSNGVILYEGKVDCVPFTNHKVVLIRATNPATIVIYVE